MNTSKKKPASFLRRTGVLIHDRLLDRIRCMADKRRVKLGREAARRLQARHGAWLSKQKSVFEELHEHLEAEYRDRLSPDQMPKDQSDAYVLEIRMLHHMSHLQLKARIQALRNNLREMLTPREYREMRADLSIVPNNHTSLTLLRWEAHALLDRVYRRYLLVPKVEEIRDKIGKNLLRVTLFLVSCSATLMLVAMHVVSSVWFKELAMNYVAPIVAGSTGAAISTLMRLHKINPRREPLMVWLSLNQGGSSISLSPVLGAVFGLVMVLFLRSGIMSGSMFPDLNTAYWDWGGVDLYTNRCPGREECRAHQRAYTGVLVWCFIAGWAERLVPDILDQVAKRGQSQIKSTERR